MSDISFLGLAPVRQGVSRICAVLIAITAVGAHAQNAPAEAGESNAVANDATPMVEMEAKFVRATKAQMQEALDEALRGDALRESHLTHYNNGTMVVPLDRAENAVAALKRNKAEFFSNPQTISRSGKRAVVEAVREMRYPTEFEPSKTELGKVLPLAFETRKVGVTMEFEPVVGPEGIDLSLVASIVTFHGFLQYPNGKSGHDLSDPSVLDELLREPLREGKAWQPIFRTQKLTTGVWMFPGQAAVLRIGVRPDGSLPPEKEATKEKGEENERDTYIFVTARVVADE